AEAVAARGPGALRELARDAARAAVLGRVEGGRAAGFDLAAVVGRDARIVTDARIRAGERPAVRHGAGLGAVHDDAAVGSDPVDVGIVAEARDDRARSETADRRNARDPDNQAHATRIRQVPASS